MKDKYYTPCSGGCSTHPCKICGSGEPFKSGYSKGETKITGMRMTLKDGSTEFVENTSDKYYTPEPFHLYFSEDYFSKGDIVETHVGTPLRVLDVPKRKHGNIFSKLINWITSDRYCKLSYSYKVKYDGRR